MERRISPDHPRMQRHGGGRGEACLDNFSPAEQCTRRLATRHLDGSKGDQPKAHCKTADMGAPAEG